MDARRRRDDGTHRRGRGRRIRRGFAEPLDRFAAQWNARLPGLVAMPPGDRRALVLVEIADAVAERDPAERSA